MTHPVIIWHLDFLFLVLKPRSIWLFIYLSLLLRLCIFLQCFNCFAYLGLSAPNQLQFMVFHYFSIFLFILTILRKVVFLLLSCLSPHPSSTPTLLSNSKLMVEHLTFLFLAWSILKSISRL